MAIAKSHTAPFQNEFELISLNSDRTWPKPERSWAMRMNWLDLLFMHYPVDADCLSSLLPASIELDLYQGQAWIGIVPFRMTGVAPRWAPDLPGVSRFPELNVRTYVRYNGKPGVWFFSLDATNPLAVRVARWLYHLNYVDAKITLTRDGAWRQYVSRRTHRGVADAELDVDYRPIGPAFRAIPGSFEFWLTARYCLYTCDRSGSLLRGEIDHSPWQLRKAQAVIRRNTMCAGLGLELPNQEPVLHFADETSVVAWSIQPVEEVAV